MKKLLVVLFILMSFKCVYAQCYVDYYSSAINYSISITYISGNYTPSSPSYYSYGNVLSAMQAKYDANLNWINREWGKLYYLELVNNANKIRLKDYIKYSEPKINEMLRKYDLARTNAAEEIVYKFIKPFFEKEEIKAEIKLLADCERELNRIKSADPYNYIYSKRYKAINETLKKLENCAPYEIKNLSWQNIELNME